MAHRAVEMELLEVKKSLAESEDTLRVKEEVHQQICSMKEKAIQEKEQLATQLVTVENYLKNIQTLCEIKEEQLQKLSCENENFKTEKNNCMMEIAKRESEVSELKIAHDTTKMSLQNASSQKDALAAEKQTLADKIKTMEAFLTASELEKAALNSRLSELDSQNNCLTTTLRKVEGEKIMAVEENRKAMEKHVELGAGTVSLEVEKASMQELLSELQAKKNIVEETQQKVLTEKDSILEEKESLAIYLNKMKECVALLNAEKTRLIASTLELESKCNATEKKVKDYLSEKEHVIAKKYNLGEALLV